MTHKHTELISRWLIDNSTQFEFAYGTGVDFIWSDCDIHYVIDNESMQVRVKERPPMKQKRWIAIEASTGKTTEFYKSRSECFDSEFSGCLANADGWQFVEIEIEV